MMTGNPSSTYPLYVPPDGLAELRPSEWSSAQARRYLTWLQTVVDERANAGLGYLGVAEGQDPEQLLLTVGEKAAWVLRKPEFSSVHGDQVKLTNAGNALAADIGLLLAKALLREGQGKVEWQILTKPKGAASFNHPVLVGFGKLHLDPIRGSIAEAYGVLKGTRAPNAWARAFKHWIRLLQHPSQA